MHSRSIFVSDTFFPFPFRFNSFWFSFCFFAFSSILLFFRCGFFCVSTFISFLFVYNSCGGLFNDFIFLLSVLALITLFNNFFLLTRFTSGRFFLCLSLIIFLLSWWSFFGLKLLRTLWLILSRLFSALSRNFVRFLIFFDSCSALFANNRISTLRVLKDLKTKVNLMKL